MKLILLMLSMIVLQINSRAQSFNFNQGGFIDRDYFLEIPYQIVKGKIIIKVKIGNDLRKFILDTGAPTAVRKSLFEELKFEVLTSEDLTDINGSKSEFQIVKINDLKLGESIIKDIPAIVLEESLLTKCFNVDGLIGSNLLRNSVIQFDSRNKLIRISDDFNKLDITNAITSEIFIDQQSSPVFKIQIGDKAKEMILFDTGVDELYSMSNTNLNKFKKTKTFSIISESVGTNSFGISGLEQESKSYRLLIPELTILGLTLKNIVSETSEDANSRFGVRLLDYGILSIDYKNSKSHFEPFSKTAILNELGWTLGMTFINEKLVVGRIWSNQIKEISVGNEILSINGKDMISISECDFLLNSPLLNNKFAILKIRNSKGEIQTVEIQKK